MNRKFAELFGLLILIIVMAGTVILLGHISNGQMVNYGGYTYRTDGTYLSVQGSCGCLMCQRARAYNYQVNQHISAQQHAAQLEAARRAAETAGTPAEAIPQIVTLLKLNSQSKLVEVGCGRGAVMLAAARQSGCHATGIEIDAELANQAAAAARQSGLPVEVIHADATQVAELTGAHVYVYLFPELLAKLRPKFQSAVRVVSFMHGIEGLKTTKHFVTVDGRRLPVFVYSAPKLPLPGIIPRRKL